MSHEVITIADDDAVVCARCTLRNEPACSVCGVCSAPLHHHHQLTRVCQACTYANGGGDLECSLCQMPLVDDVVEMETGSRILAEDHELGTAMPSTLSGGQKNNQNNDDADVVGGRG